MLTDTLQGAQVEQDIDQGIDIGDGLPISDFRTFDAQLHGLTVDPFAGGSLLVDPFVGVTVSVKLIAEASASTGSHGGGTGLLGLGGKAQGQT